MGKPALAPVLGEAARLATLDPARGETAKTAARQLLNFLTYATSVDLCHPSFEAYREGLERLVLHPDAEIVGRARERLNEMDGWIEGAKTGLGEGLLISGRGLGRQDRAPAGASPSPHGRGAVASVRR